MLLLSNSYVSSQLQKPFNLICEYESTDLLFFFQGKYCRRLSEPRYASEGMHLFLWLSDKSDGVVHGEYCAARRS